MSSQGAASTLRTPQATPFHSASTSTLPSTPVKRKFTQGSMSSGHFSQTSTTSLDTPSKRQRMEAIQAGLRARGKDDAASQPQPTTSEHQDALPFTNGVEPNQAGSAPSPASNTDTEVAEVEHPPARYSFLGLPLSQESEAGAAPSTPKKRSFCVADVGNHASCSHSSGGTSSALLTPPQSIQQHANRTESFGPGVNGSANSRPEPVTPTRSKGKERANQWDQLIQGEVRLSFLADTRNP